VSHLLVAIHSPFLTRFICMCFLFRPRPQEPQQPSPKQPPSTQPSARKNAASTPTASVQAATAPAASVRAASTHPASVRAASTHPASVQAASAPAESVRAASVQPRTRKTSPRSFDRTGFCDMMHDFGRAYWFRANELIKICRSFSAASDQSIDQDIELSR
jgi:hypothetical protein